MMKFKPLLVVAALTFLLLVLTTAVLAQEEPPPPYAGLKNPFPWSDRSAQEAGKGLYQRSCLGCHGANGDNLAQFDFSTADYPRSLEERQDYYFWILSEGKLDRGMPPYKSSLSDEQRWQVLTFIWSLGAVVPSEPSSPPAQPVAEEVSGTLLLTAPARAQSDQPLTLTAVLKDSQGKPVSNATVKFFIEVDFFTSGLMEIGEAVSNEQGVADFEYTPRQSGKTEIVARYEGDGLNTIETAAMLTLVGTNEAIYQSEAGVSLPAPVARVFIGPESALELDEMGKAPMTAFQISGGVLLWVLLVTTALILVWVVYFRVLYLMFRIPIVSEIRDTDTRLVPMVGLAVVVVLGIMLALMFVTGPNSHLHLVP